MIEFSCGACSKRMQIENSAAGQHTNCIQCGGQVLVPLLVVPARPILKRSARNGNHPRKLRGGFRICPNPHCGYRGPTILQSRGDGWILLCLLLLILPAGILYAVIFSGYRLACPHCGLTINERS